MAHFLDHVDYIAGLVGIERVGIGSDQDVVPNIPDEGRHSAYDRHLPRHLRDFYQLKFRSRPFVFR